MGSHYDDQYLASAKQTQDDLLGFISTKDDLLGFTNIPKGDIKKVTFGSGAQKHTEGKPRFDLIPPEAMKSLAEVYSLGAEKYEDRNWEKGIPFSACIAALKRHLNSFELGDMINTTDGNHEHIAHVMWWAVALTTFIKRGRTDLNDLPHYQKDFRHE